MSEYNINCEDCKFYSQKENSCKWVQWANVKVPWWITDMDIEVLGYVDRECDVYELKA